MHPALRNGPLFYKKNTPFSTFFTKTTPYISTFCSKTPPFSTFLQKAPPISFPAYGPGLYMPTENFTVNGLPKTSLSCRRHPHDALCLTHRVVHKGGRSVS